MQLPPGRGTAAEVLLVFVVFGRLPWSPGRLFYHPGPILGSAFLWRCFCPQKLPCITYLATCWAYEGLSWVTGRAFRACVG